jgi:hypothetical protein
MSDTAEPSGPSDEEIRQEVNDFVAEFARGALDQPIPDREPAPPAESNDANLPVQLSDIDRVVLGLAGSIQFVPWTNAVVPHPNAPGVLMLLFGSANGLQCFMAPPEILRQLAHKILEAVGDRPSGLKIADLGDLPPTPLLGPDGRPAGS